MRGGKGKRSSMTRMVPHPSDAAELRQQAEAIAMKNAVQSPENLVALSPEEIQRVFHELRVHQIELEMQNEELRRAQVERDTTQARYFDLYDLAPVGYITVNEQGLILEANLAAAGLLGVPRFVMVKRPLTQFILNEDQDEYYRHRNRIAETGSPQSQELRMLRHDGTAFWAHMDLATAQDADGAPMFRIVLNDITERKLAEQALRESEVKYRMLFDSVGDGIFIHNEERMLAVNPMACKRLGYTYTELMSMPPCAVDAPEEALHLPGRVAKLMEQGQITFETAHVRKDGTSVMAEVCARRIIWDGQPAVMSICRDITERKRMELDLQKSKQQQDSLASRIRVGTYIMRTRPDGASTLEYASPRLAEILNVTVENLLVDAQAVPRAIHPDDLDSFLAATREMNRQPRPFNWSGRAVVAGMLKWLHFESSPTPMVCGDTQWHGFVVDITERKQLEAHNAALEAQNRQLQKAESLGRMAESIAHHFNNKLQSVVANLDLLGELPQEMDPTHCLARAKQSTEKAAEVSRLMLLYLGQTSLERKPRFLSEVGQVSLPLIQNSLSSTVTLEADWAFPGPVIEANADQIYQILNNLLTNAWEAMSDTGGDARLSVKTYPAAEIPTAHRFPVGWQAQATEYACLEVTDNGCGIADGDFEKLFDPFFSTKFVGRGLGLSVVLGMVQAHGGAIAVTSRLGKGSVFQVYFPVSTQPVSSLSVPGVRAPMPTGNGTILVVDDDAMLLESTGAMIERMGFTVLAAKDGIEAVEVFRQHMDEIRCVLTDLTMPRMDGWETLTALRRLAPALPVILASGYGKAQVLSGAHPDRPQVFLEKPFGLQRLRDALGQALAVHDEGIAPRLTDQRKNGSE